MKKAQIKTTETILVLIIFFLILGIGLVFYGKYKISSMEIQKKDVFEEEAIKIALKVAFMPEITCTEGTATDLNCFDLYKLKSFDDINEYDSNFFLFYENDLRDSVIYVKQIFPPGERYLIYNNPPNNYTTVIPTYIPITLKDPSARFEKGFSFGLLTVEAYT